MKKLKTFGKSKKIGNLHELEIFSKKIFSSQVGKYHIFKDFFKMTKKIFLGFSGSGGPET